MSAPRLNVPLVLEQPVRIADGMGGFTTEWQALGILHAQMAAGSGGENRAEAGASSRTSWDITIRAAPEGDPRRPLPGQRFRMGARLFAIAALAETGPGGRWLRCFATEEKLA